MEEELCHISPIDGRYTKLTKEVAEHFSEYHLIRNRVMVELQWLKKLLTMPEIGYTVSQEELDDLEKIAQEMNLEGAKRVKEIEQTTKHDVKAVEYFLNEKLAEKGLAKYNHLIHFACTSEDINNIAYGIMEKELLHEVYLPNAKKVQERLAEKAREYAGIPMLSHTHGQNATPTTVGKELANFAYRLEKILARLSQEAVAGKWNGTVGNFNAHKIAYPDVDWEKVAQEFVESFGLQYNPYTTQIEPHDQLCWIFTEMMLTNNILQDFAQDMWLYISREYFLQANVAGEVGSSVMPHKINPINFENAMANLKMANGVMEVLTGNLPISRMQRDLSDSSLLRNIGNAVAYSVIASKQLVAGMNKVRVNESKLKEELEQTSEVLAEAIQTILRKNGYADAYEILKGLTRGKHISQEAIYEFVQQTEISPEDKQMLLQLTPEKYIGLASKLAKEI